MHTKSRNQAHKRRDKAARRVRGKGEPDHAGAGRREARISRPKRH